jgi:hypothetical protein
VLTPRLPPPPPQLPRRAPSVAGRAVRVAGDRPDAVLSKLRSFLEKYPGDEVTVEWRVSE